MIGRLVGWWRRRRAERQGRAIVAASAVADAVEVEVRRQAALERVPGDATVVGSHKLEATVTAGPPAPVVDGAPLRRAAVAALRQQVWEASQFMSVSEILSVVDRVVAEIVSDEP